MVLERVIWLGVALLAAPAFAVDGGQPVTVLLPGRSADLVGYWPFDTAFVDATGHGHDATVLAGTPSISTASPVVGAGALSLKGLDALTVPASAAFAGPGFAFSVWVNCTLTMSATSNSAHALFNFLDNGNPYAPVLDARLPQVGALFFESKVFSAVRSPDMGIAANTWTHLAGTYDGTQVVLYVNGLEALRQSFAPSTLPFNNSELWIGRIWPEGAPLYNPMYFIGQIDDLAIWRDQLKPDEVRLLAGLPPLDGGALDGGALDGGASDGGNDDGGAGDGGSDDGGGLAEGDAGAPGRRALRVGCGCTGAPGEGLFALALAAAVLARRRVATA